MPVADLLPELILLIGAAAIVVAASFLPHRLHWLCAIATIVLLGVSFGVVLSRWDNAAQLTFSGVWALDGGARFAKLLIFGTALAVAALSPQWMAADRRHGEYYGLLLFGLTGFTGYTELAAGLAANPDPWVIIVAFVLVLIGLGFKLGAAPVHMWMPDVAQAAPAPVAALITVITKVGAAIALARFAMMLPETLGWRWAIALMAVVTMTWGNLAALWQTNLRRLLGWSAVSQSGYALMAIVVIGAVDQSLAALLVFLTGYAVANVAAFSVVVYLRGRTELEDYRGLAHQRPWCASVIILALLSFLGLPPLIGFFGKLLLFSSVIEGGYTWLAVVAVINTVVSLFYYLRVIAILVFPGRQQSVADLGWPAAATMIVIGLMVLGLWANGLISLAQSGAFMQFR